MESDLADNDRLFFCMQQSRFTTFKYFDNNIVFKGLHNFRANRTIIYPVTTAAAKKFMTTYKKRWYTRLIKFIRPIFMRRIKPSTARFTAPRYNARSNECNFGILNFPRASEYAHAYVHPRLVYSIRFSLEEYTSDTSLRQ